MPAAHRRARNVRAAAADQLFGPMLHPRLRLHLNLLLTTTFAAKVRAPTLEAQHVHVALQGVAGRVAEEVAVGRGDGPDL